MQFAGTTLELTPQEYEFAVKSILDAAAVGLAEYESAHLHALPAHDGEYVVDVAVRFRALGADFRVLVECKHERRKVERQDVQILWSKVQSTGSHKGMVFSVAGFQSGAIAFADAHGIALVQLVDGASTWCTRSAGPQLPPPPWVTLPKYAGWWCHGNRMSLVSPEFNEYTKEALGF